MRNVTQRKAHFDEIASMSNAELAGTRGGVLPVALAVAYSGAIISGFTAGAAAGWMWCQQKFA